MSWMMRFYYHVPVNVVDDAHGCLEVGVVVRCMKVEQVHAGHGQPLKHSGHLAQGWIILQGNENLSGMTTCNFTMAQPIFSTSNFSMALPILQCFGSGSGRIRVF